VSEVQAGDWNTLLGSNPNVELFRLRPFAAAIRLVQSARAVERLSIFEPRHEIRTAYYSSSDAMRGGKR